MAANAVYTDGNVGIGTTTPQGALDVVSTNSGFILPRVANTTAVSSAVNGMLIYDLSTHCLKVYENGAWTNCLGTPLSANDSALAQIGREADSPDNVNSVITVTELGTITPALTGLLPANEAAYQDYIDANPGSFSSPATQSQVQTMVDAVNAAGPATVSSIDCNGVTITGTLTDGEVASGVSGSVQYTAGNGGVYASQSTSSSGVLGLTATLTAGSVASGAGNLVFNISGTPSGDGTASFAINFGGQTCMLTFPVATAPPPIPTVTSTTGQVWMDRNLGASQVATSKTDAAAYGDLYQWGRNSDGHQLRTSSVTSGSVASGSEGANFVRNSSFPYDWLTTQDNTRWGAVKTANDPCPSGFRIPTDPEFNAELTAYSINSLTGAYASVLKLTAAGYRNGTFSIGVIYDVGNEGYYWTSTVNTHNARYLGFTYNTAFSSNDSRTNGYSIRCIQE